MAVTLALITPALFSPPPPLPDGRRGRKAKKEEKTAIFLISVFFLPSLPSGRGGGRERGAGGVRDRPEGAALHSPPDTFSPEPANSSMNARRRST